MAMNVQFYPCMNSTIEFITSYHCYLC